MFKNITALEKTMRKILIDYNEDKQLPYIEDNRDLAYALYCCCENKYLLNLHYCQNANGDYLFDSTSNILVSKEGLEFIAATSRKGRILSNVFTLLHGTAGFILGIASALIVNYLSLYLGLI